MNRSKPNIMGPLAVAAIPHAIDLVGNVFNSITGNKAANKAAKIQADTNKWITERNIESARDLTNMQNDFNVAMWDRQNAYNDPSNQAALYEKAGFNKQVVLGQFNSSAASAQGAAGILPDYSHGNGSYAKAAYKLPEFGSAVSSILNTLNEIEEHKQNKIKSDMMFNEERFQTDYLKHRNLLSLQQWLLNGGELKDGDADNIRKHRLSEMSLKNDLLKTDLNFSNARLADHYSFSRPTARQTLKKLMNDNWMFENVEKPFQSKYGSFYKHFDHLSGTLGNILGMLPKIFFGKVGLLSPKTIVKSKKR